MKRRPGPAADSAFKTGVVFAGAAWVAGAAFLYWAGVLTPIPDGIVVLLMFPLYLVIVASGLSVWLGYDKDATDLRPVYREKESE